MQAFAAGAKGRKQAQTGGSGGPIITVTVTNHALDQFLTELLKQDIRKIVRIGGNSRSEALDPYNLNVLLQDARRRLPRFDRLKHGQLMR